MSLKMEEITVRYVDFQDFEQYVEQLTGKEYDYCAAEECSNDTEQFYYDIRREAKYKEDMEEVQDWIEGRGTIDYRAGDLLTWLCVHGHIPPGNYLISVSW